MSNNEDTLQSITDHVAHARGKHPDFKATWTGKFLVLFEEILEFLWAVIAERDRLRIRNEALDIIAVLVRIIEGDGGKNTMQAKPFVPVIWLARVGIVSVVGICLFLLHSCFSS